MVTNSPLTSFIISMGMMYGFAAMYGFANGKPSSPAFNHYPFSDDKRSNPVAAAADDTADKSGNNRMRLLS